MADVSSGQDDMTNQEWLRLCVLVAGAMSSPSIDDNNYLSGSCVLSLDIKSALQQLSEGDFFLDSKGALTASVGDTVSVEIQVPRSESCFFAYDWSDFLENFSFKWKRPEDYFIIAEPNGSARASAYDLVVRLANALSSVADYVENKAGDRSLVFLGKSRLEFVIDYPADLLDRSFLGVEYLEEFIADADKHKDQRFSIIKASLFELLANDDAAVRFETFVKRLDVFIKAVKHGYYLYVSEFSYEKTLEDARKAQLDFSVRINKLLSDMQNQLIAIPAAFIFVGTQFKLDKPELLFNMSIFLGGIIFGGLMSILLRNQRDSLSAILVEVLSERNRHDACESQIKSELHKIFLPLDGRVASFKFKLWLIDFAVASVVFLTFVFFLLFVMNQLGWSASDYLQFVKRTFSI